MPQPQPAYRMYLVQDRVQNIALLEAAVGGCHQIV